MPEPHGGTSARGRHPSEVVAMWAFRLCSDFSPGVDDELNGSGQELPLLKANGEPRVSSASAGAP